MSMYSRTILANLMVMTMFDELWVETSVMSVDACPDAMNADYEKVEWSVC